MAQTKINTHIRKIGLLCICIAMGLFSQAQNSKKLALQKQYNNILLEIKQLQNNLDQTKQQQNISIKQVSIINSKIDKRKKLIQNIEIQKSEIEEELENRLSEVKSINSEVGVLKAEYAKMILWLNKNHNSVNKLAFVLEANSFKEAYHRIQYMKKYGDFRAKQSIYLTNQINRILEKINTLNIVKAEKLNIIQANKHQQNELMKEKQNRDSLVKKLSNEIGALKSQVREKNQKAAAINARIKRIIEEEINKQREQMIAEAKAKRQRERKNSQTSTSSLKNTQTKEAEPKLTSADYEKSPEGILSNSFQASRGNLPWPVSSGNITSKFGRQPHPADPEIFVDNNGIDIRTAENASVKAIYKGKVVRIFDMPTYQTCVMVKHGDFFTVYSHLTSVNVIEGAEIQSGHPLGKASYDEGHGYALINLQIWHYQNKQNPQAWLQGR